MLAALGRALQSAGEEPADAVRRAQSAVVVAAGVMQGSANGHFIMSGRLRPGERPPADELGIFIGVASPVSRGLLATPLAGLAGGAGGAAAVPATAWVWGAAAATVGAGAGAVGVVIGAMAAPVACRSTAGFIKYA